MMKKLTFDELENTLDREDMRNIMAGSGGSGTSCRIYYESSGWGCCCWSPSEAQAWYNNEPNITGYCCASCENSCY